MNSETIHNILRNRLFDYTRRNRLLYFKSSLKHFNLSVASVQVNEPVQNITPSSLFIWNDSVSANIIQSKDILLSKYIHFSEVSYAQSALNKIRLQANKDVNEYGFNQLRLVISFLQWFDVKNNGDEKIISPLILIPVSLVKKKGVIDEFIIKFSDADAEINPVLAGRLKELYNIDLPEKIELSKTSIGDLFHLIKKQIELTSDIELVDSKQPNFEQIHWQATKLHEKYNKRKSSEVSIFSEELVSLNQDDEINKKWEFDTTNIVIGNFNYRKMSLVRDYDSLMDNPLKNEVFDQLFDELPTSKNPEIVPVILAEQFHVIQADPTHQTAINFARNNKSYIIQGPPGTGKSQTIANLIADFVARGKKVLFVCEKRAAIDVVYHRLKQRKLDEFCSLIHDSQTDKKEFVMSLKKTSESYAKNNINVDDIAHKRNQIIYQIERELYSLRLFHIFMKQRLEKANVNVRQLLDIVISTQKFIDDVNISFDKTPSYDQWTKYGESIKKISYATFQSENHLFFGKHPLSQLNESAYFLYDRSNTLNKDLGEALILINQISEKLAHAEIPQDIGDSVNAISCFVNDVALLFPFHEVKMLDLLSKGTLANLQFENAIKHIRSLENSITELLAKNNYWIQKFSATDAEHALKIVQKHEGKFFSFLSSNYRKTKRAISKSYDFSKHQTKPSFTQILTNLHNEYYQTSQLKNIKFDYENIFKLGELFELEQKLKTIYQTINEKAFDYLKGITQAAKIKEIYFLFQNVEKKLTNKFLIPNNFTISELNTALQSIIDKLKDLPLFLPHLKELSTAELSLKNLVTKSQYTPQQIEALLAKSSMIRFLQLNPEIEKMEGVTIKSHIEKIEKLYEKFMQINALYICSKQHDKYSELITKSQLSVAGKSEVEKEEKSNLMEGRRILQNEFDKSMRYKSIRDLATLESGRFIRELKPVWLMSPLSVSDTLPLQTDYFDVVIFDEASQITLEEGMPSIYRAKQTIVVGDEMQMPPSRFFTTNSFEEENEDSVEAESFLQQSARKFPSVMLGWHYRSRHESLIGFSNAAFYENRLLTIPDNIDQEKALNPITADKKEDGVNNLLEALRRPISYHFLAHGIYDERTNISEAEYIAEMVREILKDENSKSIGVVAFSKEQQGEIEDAIQRLAATDEQFDQNLEEEYKRVDDGQFMGIFFKNLENIQGDERDIIIMSTCYGYNANGRMLMNFGPINRMGGEKRLNVIFSRAKRNMVVVSSIKHTDIKNEHNAGSNYFRKYLQYAELASVGDMKSANAVLKSILSIEAYQPEKNIESAVLSELRSALEINGYVVKSHIGQSNFTCQLGIKKNESDESFTAGILLDEGMHYASDDVLEQYLFKPQLLENNGWKIIQVFAKDWYMDSEKVLEQVIYAIENREKPNEITEVSTAETEVMIESTERKFIRLENHENGNPKFWEVLREGTHLIIQYGKVGSKGTSMVKPFSNKETAEKKMQKLIEAKMKAGYKR